MKPILKIVIFIFKILILISMLCMLKIYHNLPHLSWNSSQNNVPFSVQTPSDSMLFEFVSLHNLNQINNFTNNNNRILDLVLVNDNFNTKWLQTLVPIFQRTVP